MSRALLAGHSVVKRVADGGQLPGVPAQAWGGLTYVDLEVRPPGIREYIDRLRTIVSENGIRTLILLLGDNDFTFRNGALRPT